LSIEDQREEFYVRWAPRGISLVKFEYRQLAKPATIFEKTYAPHGTWPNSSKSAGRISQRRFGVRLARDTLERRSTRRRKEIDPLVAALRVPV